jgi:hypothetical protein
LLEDRGRDGAFRDGARGMPALACASTAAELPFGRRAECSCDGFVPLLDGAAILSRFREAEQSGALECGDVMVQAGRRLAEAFGDLFRGPRSFGEELHEAEPERVGEGAHLGDVGREGRRAGAFAASRSGHAGIYGPSGPLTRNNSLFKMI